MLRSRNHKKTPVALQLVFFWLRLTLQRNGGAVRGLKIETEGQGVFAARLLVEHTLPLLLIFTFLR